MSDERFELEFRAWTESRASAPPSDALRARVMAIPTQHRGGFLPPLTGRFQSMFSATKLVVAGAVVALFGGLLFTGVLAPQQEVDAPIAGSTPTPSTTAAAVSTRADLLPGVELVARELAPTVFEVLDDGAGHDLSRMRLRQVVRTPDGGAWVWAAPEAGSEQGPERIYRLGEPGSSTVDGKTHSVGEVEVGADGRIYARIGRLRQGRTVRHWVVLTEQGWVAATSEDRAAAKAQPDPSVGASVVAADGATWELKGDDDRGHEHIVRVGPDGRTRFTVEDMDFDWGKKGPGTKGLHMIRPWAVAVAADGRVWVLWGPNRRRSNDFGVGLAEFDGQTWTDITPPEWRADEYLGRPEPAGIIGASLSVEPDSTLRARLELHDSRMHRGSGVSSAPVARLEASWDGARWTAESRTTWDLASLAETPAADKAFWIADVASDGTMLLVTWDFEKDSGLYVIRPEIDDDPDEAALMVP